MIFWSKLGLHELCKQKTKGGTVVADQRYGKVELLGSGILHALYYQMHKNPVGYTGATHTQSMLYICSLSSEGIFRTNQKTAGCI
jgi:hypothetical protein